MISVSASPAYLIGRDDDPKYQSESRDRAISLVQQDVLLLDQIGSNRKLYLALVQLRTLTEQLVRDYPVHTQSTIIQCRTLFSKIISVVDSNKFMPLESGQMDMEELLTIFDNRRRNYESAALTLPDPQSSRGDL